MKIEKIVDTSKSPIVAVAYKLELPSWLNYSCFLTPAEFEHLKGCIAYVDSVPASANATVIDPD